jgi:hypothetical protein
MAYKKIHFLEMVRDGFLKGDKKVFQEKKNFPLNLKKQ